MNIFKRIQPDFNAFARNISYKNILVEKLGNVTAIGINRPEKRNCVDEETAEELKEAIKSFEDDADSFAGVLHGVGGNFCAGYDLKSLTDVGRAKSILNKETGFMGPTMRYIKKPMIASISGYAVAGGLELALMCDMRIVEETAVMGVFCRRFGVPLIDGGTVRLQAIVGLSRALDYTLTGRAISAKEALDCGLANRITDVGTGLGQAINLAGSLVKFPQSCLLADRASTYNAAFASSYTDLLKFERENGRKVDLALMTEGAGKFARGVGRHGKAHHLTEISDIPDWEQEENVKMKK